MTNNENIDGTSNKKVRLSKHTEVDRAVWFAVCLDYAAGYLNVSVKDLARELSDKGLSKWLIDGYDVFHTQGYEYMAEKIAAALKDANENA